MKMGDFIRVREDHPDAFRAGKDGMVIRDSTENEVALVFYNDRYGNHQFTECVGPEQWDIRELDISTLDKSI